MFITAIKPSYSIVVKVLIPGEAEGDFDLEVRRQSQPEINEMWEKVRSGEWTDGDVLRKVSIGWKRVKEEDGTDMAFSETNLDRLLKMHGVEGCMASAFAATVKGARQKN